MLKNRIEHKLKNEKFFGDMQTGFRKDLASAYDNVNLSKLRESLNQGNVNEDIIKIIMQLLEIRRISIRSPNTGELSGPQGLAQGSPLSPLLFNIYTASLAEQGAHNTKILQYADDLALIETESGRPCFRADLETQITKLQWINSHITKGGIGSELDFEDLMSRYPEHEIIYTDASIDHETGRSGIGVHSPTANLDLAERIQNGTITCKAEMLVIDRAITERTNNTDKLIIIADSRSALDKKTKSGINAKNDNITLNVRRKLIDAKARNKDIELIWVPSHTGITGNDRADKLANEALIEKLKEKIAPSITVQKIITYSNAVGAKLLIEQLGKNKIKL
ncbi:hypothetical protein JTB14_030451 [Gonioctena quinquepunctata]|nr:hypothetical protein JTB14_030451 [Gonioctena quinquepunctata]